MDKRKITLTIDRKLLREVRIVAAAQGTSVGTLLAKQLEQLVRGERGYDAARRRAVARLRKGLRLEASPSPARATLHER